jgi:hypothetical protein
VVVKAGMTLADKLLVGLLVVAAVSSYSLVHSFTRPGSIVLVEVDGRLIYRADLMREERFVVPGRQGAVTIAIEGGNVAVVEADCPNRICQRMGRRNTEGDAIVCVPNGLVVKIGGREGGKVRAITG